MFVPLRGPFGETAERRYPEFARSVILLLEHGSRSVGLILNKPSPLELDRTRGREKCGAGENRFIPHGWFSK